MKLYTSKGDGGTTTIFGCDQRISKSSAITEALGTLDEANSYLGLCKVLAEKEKIYLSNDLKVATILHALQNDLFTIQAELAGADKSMTEEGIDWLEIIIAEIENDLPEIKTFFISGGCEISSRFDFARTLIRRAERRVVRVNEEKIQKIDKNTLSYLNRLSSLLYVLARFSNLKDKIEERSPKY